MSAESPRKSSRQGGHVVAPQPVSDRSIIESVAGFINEVVPQAYTSAPHGESKEAITWARFEYGDINDPALYPDTTDDRNGSPPLLLVLGYGSGVQVWAVPASGEATEVLSWRQGVVRTLRILPTPGSDSNVPDAFAHKRPLVAMCDSAGGPSPQFCSLNFISLRGGDQVKNIKFNNPVSDVLANRRSVVVTFPERIAVFDASTLGDRLTVTTCYPCPGPNPNPVALGSRWLAYSERKLMPAHRSSGGTEGEGVQSYTATMLHAAKSFGKGLRELGETVASSLTGGTGVGMQRGMGGGVCGPMGGQPGGNMLGNSDAVQPGVITILDAQGTSSSGHVEDTRVGDSMMNGNSDNIVAHFLAHSDPVVAVAFDPSGMLLLTADKRGHDFHVFRIHPHPGGSSLAAVHHLYVLHRGDTTAKVQDIAFAADSRWVAVSTLRGTTHVFPITPYGGPVGIRTHATPHVVNRLSRFHRSAGLTADGRNSPVPIPVSETVSTPPSIPYPNPRLPPYSHPTVISPLAQIRQPMTHTLLSTSTPTSLNPASQQTYHRNPSMRTLGRTQSSSDDGLPGGGIPLRVTACFAPPRAWLIGSPTVPRDTPAKAHKRAVDSLFVMACHGNLIEYDLEPKHAAGIPKEKICDDTAIELDVQPKAQWMLLRPPHASELQPPLSPTNPLMVLPDRLPTSVGCESRQDDSDSDERWLSQVEIVTHAGPHRRLWMGPQFTFKTYNSTGTGIPLSLLEMEAVEVGVGSGSRPARSNPVNMPIGSGSRPVVPVLIESGSGSSYEQSPRLLEAYGTDGADSDGSAGPGETQLREDLADAMMESPGVPIRDTGRRVIVEMCRGTPLTKKISNPIQKVVNPVGTVITVSCPSEEGSTLQAFSINAATEHKSSSDDEIHRHHISTAENPVPKSTKDIPCKTSRIPDELLLWKYSNEDSVRDSNTNSQATIKWPAVTKSADSHKTINTVKSKSIVGLNIKSEISTSSTFGSKVQSKDTESKPQRKDNFSERKMGDKSKWSRKEDKVAITLVGTVLKEDNESEYGNSSPYGKQKDIEAKKDEVKNKSQKNFSSRRFYSDAEDDSSIDSKESNEKNKAKVQESSKSKDNGNTASKKQISVVGSLISQETAKKEKITKSEENILSGTSQLKGKITKSEENISSETSPKLDEIKIENKNYKKGTKQKLSRITEDNSKSVSGNESQLGIEEKKEINDAFKFSVAGSALTNLPLLDFPKKEELSSDDVYVSLDFDSLITTTPMGVKKATAKTKSREFKVSKDISLKAEEIHYCKNEDSDTKHCKNEDSDTKRVQHEICTSLLSEHHFGDKSKSSLRGDSSPPEASKLDEKFESRMLDFDSYSSNAKESDDSLFKSTIDKVIVQPHRSWSSVVSSSKSLIKETVTSSETLLPDLEDFKLSPAQSWSDVTSTEVDSSLAPLENRESSAVYKFNAVDFKKLEDTEDYSDDGEDKVTVGSNKSQSSDRTSGSDMVTASESLGIVVTSESSTAVADNEEEINGNDDDVLENGDSAGAAAGTGGNKKSRRAKKKRR